MHLPSHAERCYAHESNIDREIHRKKALRFGGHTSSAESRTAVRR